MSSVYIVKDIDDNIKQITMYKIIYIIIKLLIMLYINKVEKNKLIT